MSKVQVAGSKTSFTKGDENDSTSPDFIYGGPFINVDKPSPLLDTATPINLQLQGTFKKSFAYYSLKERLPIILTKVIDYCSREASKIKASNSASDQDLQGFIRFVSKLKSDLVTNKKYEPLSVDTPEAKKWNKWIEDTDNKHFFTNTWVFTECYIYRKLREACEIHPTLNTFDPFEDQKITAFNNTLEPMCIVAEKLQSMLPESEKDKRKADFITLVKICLWANKCDLSLSNGEQVSLKGEAPAPSKGEPSAEPAAPLPCIAIDPFQMILDFKDKLLVDDSGKAADQIFTKVENIRKFIEANTTFKFQCSCHRLATLAGVAVCKEETEQAPEPIPAAAGKGAKGVSPPPPAEPPSDGAEGEAPPEPPKIPCPAKMTVPQAVMFDIVCDNAGYELFADLCFGHFLIAQKIVDKVRFHVKRIPWFVSDVTPKDFRSTIDMCRAASFSKIVQEEPKPDAAEDAPPPEPRVISSDRLRTLGEQWGQFLADGTFILMSDDFWTAPHTFKDMKKYDYNLYRKLQHAAGIMFKGDLNYRKLLGERNCLPTLGFEAALQGFIPAPILAVRTVKAELVCGLPKGKFEQISKIDPQWMRKGDYGVINFCGKGEALKVADRPCLDYSEACMGVTCPMHTEL